MLIDLFTTDLVASFKEIATMRQALLKKWRFDLLRAYTQKWDRYKQQLARQEERKRRYQQEALPAIGVVLLLVCGAGAWMTFRRTELVCLGMILMLGTGFAALLTTIPWMALSQTPPPPENPVTRTSNDEAESPLRQRLFPKLVPLWRREMAVPVPSEAEAGQRAAETGKWGLLGEYELIRELERVVSPETYILHSLQPRHGDDMDVVVIGPKGIWYFEVKHWHADFVWQDGEWQVWQENYRTRTLEPAPPMREYPDAQWKRMRDEALAHLRSSAGDLLKRAPVLANIQGGIVFSHPEARLEIDRAAPFRYGTVEQWVHTYQAAPRLKDMTAGRALVLLEALLQRHQSLHPDVPRRSMREAVANVVGEVERGIREWMESY